MDWSSWISSLTCEHVHEAVRISAFAMIANGIVVFVALLVLPAPYGRYSASKGWGVLLPAPMAWLVMESPNLLLSALLLDLFPKISYFANCDFSIPARQNLIVFGFYLLHYVHRAIIFPIFAPDDKSAPMPVTVAALALFYCSWNAVNQTLATLFLTTYDSNYIYTPQFMLGAVLFVLGFCINVTSDYSMVFQKRRHALTNPQSKYIIPRGLLYDYVSNPNYLGECVEWVGFAAISGHLAAWAFVIYTVCNLVPRALTNHRWYQDKFKEDYPHSRRAIFPGLL